MASHFGTFLGRVEKSDLNEERENIDKLWLEGALIIYIVFGILLGGMYVINHIFDWNGMIANLVIFMLFSMVIVPNLTAPTITGGTLLADSIIRLIPGINPKVLNTYFDKVLPNILFWALLAVGSMAVLPWHMGPFWTIIPFIAGSWFMVVHYWKYRQDTTIVRDASYYYVFGVIVVSIGFMLGLNKPVENFVNWINPPDAYTEDGTNWLMNPVTGTIFKTEPQEGCARWNRCFDPNHSDGDGGTDLVPYQESVVNALRQAAYRPPQTSTGALVFGGNSVTTAPRAPTCTGMNCQVRLVQPGEAVQLIAQGDGTAKPVCFRYNPSSLMEVSDFKDDGVVIGKILTYTGSRPQQYTFSEFHC